MRKVKVGDRVYLKRGCPLLKQKGKKRSKFRRGHRYPVIALIHGLIVVESGSRQAYAHADEVSHTKT
jgi:hypothetical protein